MSAASQKIIYVMGLGHSGSTVLDMLLTTGKKAVGLGQVWTVLGEDFATSKKRICSCGETALRCPLWGPVLEETSSLSSDVPLWARYEIVLARVAHLFGPEVAIVDSSKLLDYVAMLRHNFQGVDLQVIHNVKDVRAFTVSMLDNSRRKSRKVASPEKIFFQWYRDNRRSHAEASTLLGRPPASVMYEGLCLATGVVTQRLADALGQQYVDLDVPLNSGHTHIISGNRLRLKDEGGASTLAYDYRWIGRREWLRPYMLMPMVRKYNERCLHDFGGLG